MKQHEYSIVTAWTGNAGTGTSSYAGYRRDHEMRREGKRAAIEGSSDPAFRGDASRYNPEELLIASLSACHMLWYLHLCAVSGIVVTAYQDDARGTLALEPDGSGRMARVTLRPTVTIEDASKAQKAIELHHAAHEKCFIAASVNFPVECEPVLANAQSAV